MYGKNIYSTADAAKMKKIAEFCEDYKDFLNFLPAEIRLGNNLDF